MFNVVRVQFRSVGWNALSSHCFFFFGCWVICRVESIRDESKRGRTSNKVFFLCHFCIGAPKPMPNFVNVHPTHILRYSIGWVLDSDFMHTIHTLWFYTVANAFFCAPFSLSLSRQSYLQKSRGPSNMKTTTTTMSRYSDREKQTKKTSIDSPNHLTVAFLWRRSSAQMYVCVSDFYSFICFFHSCSLRLVICLQKRASECVCFLLGRRIWTKIESRSLSNVFFFICSFVVFIFFSLISTIFAFLFWVKCDKRKREKSMKEI